MKPKPKTVNCLTCGKPKIQIRVVADTGYIDVVKGHVVINNMTDGCVTVDFYCDECAESV